MGASSKKTNVFVYMYDWGIIKKKAQKRVDDQFTGCTRFLCVS